MILKLPIELLQYIAFDTGLDASDVASLMQTSRMARYMLCEGRVYHRMLLGWCGCVRLGYIDAIKLMLSRGANPNQKRNYALFTALKLHYFEIFDCIINDPRFNFENYEEYVLQAVLEDANIPALQYLLDNALVDPTKGNNDSIVYAVQMGDLSMTSVLLSDDRVDPGCRENISIYNAVLARDVDMCTLLLNSARVDPSSHYNACFQQAHVDEATQIMKLLLTNDQVQHTLDYAAHISVAAELGQVDILQMLIEKGKDRASVHILTAWECAVLCGQYTIVEYLLENTNVNPLQNDNIRLYIASQTANIDMIDLLHTHPAIQAQLHTK